MLSFRSLLTALLMAQVLNLSLYLPELAVEDRAGLNMADAGGAIDSFTELMSEQLTDECAAEAVPEESEGDHTGGVQLLKYLGPDWQLPVPSTAEGAAEQPMYRTGAVVGGSLPTYQPPEAAACVWR